jgi:hypothetical protein
MVDADERGRKPWDSRLRAQRFEVIGEKSEDEIVAMYWRTNQQQ